jgi:hypothetical protein
MYNSPYVYIMYSTSTKVCVCVCVCVWFSWISVAWFEKLLMDISFILRYVEGWQNNNHP